MITDTIRFWSFLIVLIPSILCTLFVLYHLLSERGLRQAINNHVLIVLLIICLVSEVTIYPWMLYYYQHKDTWERPYYFCLTWGFFDWSLYIVHTMVFGWATIERHIIIFHDNWVSTKMKRLLFHYLPLILLVLCLFIFYIVIYYFAPCQNRLRPTSLVCIFPCLYDSETLSMWDFVANQIVPTIVITVFSMGLLVRVLIRKRRMHRTVHWRKQRNIIIQALSNSVLYLLVLLPYAVIYIIRNIYNISSPLLSDLNTLTVYFSYFILLLFPFVCTFSSSELRGRMKTIFHLRRHVRQVGPTIITLRTGGTNRTLNQ